MTLRVLFADDQIPSPDQAENERTRNEIRRELGAKLIDVDSAFVADFHWFQGLLEYFKIKRFANYRGQVVRRGSQQDRTPARLRYRRH